MAREDSPTKAAADRLWALITAVQQAFPGAEQQDQVRGFLQALRGLAMQVATADGTLTQAEDETIRTIFWFDRSTTNQATLSLIQNAPLLEAFSKEVEQVGPLISKLNIKDLNFSKTIEYILGVVASADGVQPRENAQLACYSARLQAALPSDYLQDKPLELTNPLAPARAPSAAQAGSPESPHQDSDARSVQSVMGKLDQLIGLATVKHEVETLTNLAKVFAMRKQAGLHVPDMSFHLVFLGNPGTGKTTVARIIAELYGCLGLLSKGHLVEVDRSGLIAEYVGQTAIKTQGVIDKALGGVLFIDEAYALDGGEDNDYGNEAVATLLKAMEDHRSDLVVIAAGYTDQMNRFLGMNPGLRSRMSRDISFPDYSPAEMLQILYELAKAAQYSFAEGTRARLEQIIQSMWDHRAKDFANARDVRNLFEQIVEAQANRIGQLPAADRDEICEMCEITAGDIEATQPAIV
ncbi:AAA family ATPase [Sphingomonas ginkgonis]|uniref:AAA family ATPase n=1 Tax=Sphingomonas ginkgonis TaxID=2315330 RepID=A0A429VBM0_9SPHN|nr:AAA family ATPase [Sphingomonas ginkgonis]RST31354.1 AAA family ATPase [Sphingomonas ginkgonis]